MNRKLLGRRLEIAKARVRRDPEFARTLLKEAVQALLTDDLPVARSLIRDIIKGTIGYGTLSCLAERREKGLMRIVGANGKSAGDKSFCCPNPPTAKQQDSVLDGGYSHFHV